MPLDWVSPASLLLFAEADAFSPESWSSTLVIIGRLGSLIFVVLTVHRLPRLVKRWRAVRRSYGGIPWPLVAQMVRYSRKSPAGFLITAVSICVPVTLVLGFRWLVYGDPPEYFLFALAGQVYLFSQAAEFLLPPTVLLLGSSTQAVSTTLWVLNLQLPDHRSVSLLRAPDDWSRLGPLVPHEVRRAFHWNNLRTASNYEWRSIVFHLMDVVPIIVIDADTNRAAVAEELDRIVRRRYQDRTAMVAETAAEGEQTIRRVPRDALAGWIRVQLDLCVDFDGRLRRQQEIGDMIAALPTADRDPQSILGLVSKSRSIVLYETTRLIHRCRPTPPPPTEMPLLEEIPSPSERAKELGAFRAARGLEEVEILEASALEWLEQNPGATTELNRAINSNSRGHLARLRGDFTEAVRLMGDAIRRLEDLRSGPLAPHAIPELATAYFNLGEIHMARFLERAGEEERSAAAECFEKCIAIDRHLGADTRLAEYRLGSLKMLTPLNDPPLPATDRLAVIHPAPESYDVVPTLPAAKPSSLHLAVAGDDAVLTIRLLDDGAEVNAKDLAGKTPLEVAVRNESTLLESILLQRGADPALVPIELIEARHERDDRSTSLATAFMPLLGLAIAGLASAVVPVLDDLFGIDQITLPNQDPMPLPERAVRIHMLIQVLVWTPAVSIVGLALGRIFLDIGRIGSLLCGVFVGIVVAQNTSANATLAERLAGAGGIYFAAGMIFLVLSTYFLVARDGPWRMGEKPAIRWWTVVCRMAMVVWMLLLGLAGIFVWQWSWWISAIVLFIGAAAIPQAAGLVVKVDCPKCGSPNAYSWRGREPAFCSRCKEGPRT